MKPLLLAIQFLTIFPVKVRGDVLISVLNARLDIDLPQEESHTISGLVMDRLGRIPQVGDTVQIERIHLRVAAVAHRSATEEKPDTCSHSESVITEVGRTRL